MLKIVIPVLLLATVSCKSEPTATSEPAATAEKTEKEKSSAAPVQHDNPVLVGEENLNTELLEEMIGRVVPLKPEQLWGTWEIVTARMQTNYADKNEAPVGINMDTFEGYRYLLHKDGTFDCIALIDSDGNWELRANNTRLYLYNNLRDDEEEHYLLLSEDKLEVIYVDKDDFGDSYFYMRWRKIEE